MNFLTKEMIFRDYEANGIESSGPHQPVKAEIVAYLGQLEIGSKLGAVIVKTRAELDAITDKPDYTPAIVGADSNHALSGYYQWAGGTWNYVRDLADSITRLTDIGGSGNAITARLRLGVSLSAVEFAFFVPVQNNTGAVTITVENVEKPIINGLGNELSEDDLQAGYPAMVAVFPGRDGYVLLNPANVEAVVLAAKQAAITARNQALAAKQASEEALDNLEAAVEQASELAFQRFNKLYLGSFNINPSEDNQGDPLEDGALFFHQAEKKIKVYSKDDGGWNLVTPDTSDFLNKADNLSNLPSKSAARDNLGLGALATLDIVTNDQIPPKSIWGSRLTDKAVTDSKLNSGILNRLDSLPKIVAMHSSIEGSSSFNLRRRNTKNYEFITPQPDTNYVVQVIGQDHTLANVSYTNIPGIRQKVKGGFQIGGLRMNTSGSVSSLAGDFDVIVYRVSD